MYSALNKKDSIRRYTPNLPRELRENENAYLYFLKIINNWSNSFSKFKKISEVPQYGLTVGLSTISKLSKSAILVLTGKEKSYALQKIIEASKFDKSWPSTIIFDCEKYKIYVDQKTLQNK